MESSPKTSPPSIEVQKTPTSALLIATLTMMATLTSQSFTSASSRSSQLLTLTRAVNSSRIKSQRSRLRRPLSNSALRCGPLGDSWPKPGNDHLLNQLYHEYRTVEL